MATITLSNLSKSFGSTKVLDGVSLDIADGEFISLLGPSGCGKSTLLRIIAGLETQDSGDVAIEGHNVDHLQPSARNLAMVFQSYALYPHLSVIENMLVPLRMRDLSSFDRLPLLGALSPGRRAKLATMEARARDVAETLRITHLLARKPGQLSGGQRQRVALGRAMVREPAAFLMDEPLSNLDAGLRVHMRTEIAELHRALATTFIYVTHDQVEAMTMSSRIAVMLDGRIEQIGTPAEIYNEPQNQRVAEFIGSPKINVIDAIADEAGCPVLGGRRIGKPMSVEPGTLLRVGIRPEHLILAKAGQAAVFGHLRHLENLGPEVLLHVRLQENDQIVIASLDPVEARTLVLGQPVGLTFRAEDARIFGPSGARCLERPVSIKSAAYG